MRGAIAALGVVVLLQGTMIMWQQVQLYQTRASVREMEEHMEVFYGKTGRLDQRFQLIEQNQDRLYRNQETMIEKQQELIQTEQQAQAFDWVELLLPMLLFGG